MSVGFEKKKKTSELLLSSGLFLSPNCWRNTQEHLVSYHQEMTWGREGKSNSLAWGLKYLEGIIICQKRNWLQVAVTPYFQPGPLYTSGFISINMPQLRPERGSEMDYLYPLSQSSQGQEVGVSCFLRRETDFLAGDLCTDVLPQSLGHCSSVTSLPPHLSLALMSLSATARLASFKYCHFTSHSQV